MKPSEHRLMQHALALPELTLRGILLGALLTILFTISNLYLGLKIGLTFSASIPVAVLSVIIFRAAKTSNILENNIVQSQASAASTQPALIFVLPAMLMIGYWQGFALWQTIGIAAFGGCLGVLFTIPLRRVMVDRRDLAYPEGVAAAEILKVGSRMRTAGSSALGLRELLAGSGVAGVITLLTGGLRVLSDSLPMWLSIGRSTTQLALGFSTALMGVGYLIGMRSGITMLVGLLIAWAGFIPYLTATEVLPDGMTMQAFAAALYQQKVRLVGAGALGITALSTLLTLVLSRPVLLELKEAFIGTRADSVLAKTRHRTDTDMPMKNLGIIFWVTIAGLIAVFYTFVSPADIPPVQKVLLTCAGVGVGVIVGFFVSAGAAYMSGLVGSSSSPLSGIGILGIIISSLIIYAMSCTFDLFAQPWSTQFAAAISIFITAVIFAVASIANCNIENLKTGYLIGATPRRQQTALLIGTIVGALIIAPALNILYEAYGFPDAMPRPDMDPAQALSAPQATLITAIARAVFSGELHLDYLYIGMGLGAALICIDVLLKHTTQGFSLSPLTISMGIYLPPTIQTPIIVGAILSGFLSYRLRKTAGAAAEDEGHRRGTLFAAGLIVGESLMGLLLACVIVYSVTNGGSAAPLALVGAEFEGTARLLGLTAFIAALILLGRVVCGRHP